MTRMTTALSIAIAVAATTLIGQGAIVTEMTPQRIAEAIAAGEKGDVPSGHIVQSSGFSWGSAHIATFSTPYMRVAMAAKQAKKEYGKFTADQVTPDMVAPELHVYAWAQGGDSGTSAASVNAVVITPKKGSTEEKARKAIHPTRFEDIPMTFQNLFGAKADGRGRMAVFPLNALSEDNEVHVVYDSQATLGRNAAGGRHCDDCHAPFSLKGVK
jgi:hypothetical protein